MVVEFLCIDRSAVTACELQIPRFFPLLPHIWWSYPPSGVCVCACTRAPERDTVWRAGRLNGLCVTGCLSGPSDLLASACLPQERSAVIGVSFEMCDVRLSLGQSSHGSVGVLWRGHRARAVSAQGVPRRATLEGVPRWLFPGLGVSGSGQRSGWVPCLGWCPAHLGGGVFRGDSSVWATLWARLF